ncbi:MAG: replicative DNA helicase [Candidatus Eremiobacteraeota bacterium]|nr:replicative DNA helicase [Candidatus Eremiobacteraeota bacterium]
MQISVDRVPPQNLDAETSALGACLIEKEALARVAEILPDPADFYRTAHQVIYNAILKLYERGEPVDLITLTNELRNSSKLDEVGGVAYLTFLIDSVPTAANAEYYSTIIKEKAILRNLITAGMNITGMGYREDEAAEMIVDRAETEIFGIAQKRMLFDFVPLKKVMATTFEKIEDLYARKAHVTGVSTGYRDLDHYTAGLQKANLIVVAARPGMGKTAICLNIAHYLATREKLPVAIFSLEMAKEELAQRFLCAEARIDAQRLRTGYLEETDWPRLTRAMNVLCEAPVFIDDTPNLSVMEMRSKARRLKSKHGIELVVIDYIQLIRGSSRIENRNQEISEISRQLKALSKELSVPVIAISQLSREVEKRQDKRPMLSDLRESGAIEQEADMVIFIYRDDYYNPHSEKKNKAEIIIAKQRSGPLATIDLIFLKQFTVFVSEEKIHVEE